MDPNSNFFGPLEYLLCQELEHMRKVNEMSEEETIRSFALYKKKLPKDCRTESKTRIAMFKESLRISCQVSYLFSFLFCYVYCCSFFLFFPEADPPFFRKSNRLTDGSVSFFTHPNTMAQSTGNLFTCGFLLRCYFN